MRFDVLTLHPDLVAGPLSGSILGRAVEQGWIEIGVVDIRDHGVGRHRTVDDTPYGGGAGMVMRVDVVVAAIEAVRREDSHVILLAAQGRRFVQARARELSALSHVVLVCGHYEGLDARVEAYVDEVVSLGDFVLTGGEIAASAVVDAVARLVPGVLGNADSPLDESFSEGLLEYPQFTRPAEFRGAAVPDVLLSGHHARIAQWRHEQSVALTESRRPDLFELWSGRADVDDSQVDQ
ncbi:MAG: tRNA (guanosine(37)-N1)-methyltransferase TrmD [Myxococcota bacterium]